MLWSRRRLSSCTLSTCFRSEMISPSTVTRRSRFSVLPSLSSNAGRNHGRGLVNLLRKVHAPQEVLEARVGAEVCIKFWPVATQVGGVKQTKRAVGTAKWTGDRGVFGAPWTKCQTGNMRVSISVLLRAACSAELVGSKLIDLTPPTGPILMLELDLE